MHREVLIVILLCALSTVFARPGRGKLHSPDTFDDQIGYLEYFGYLPSGRKLQHPTYSEPDVRAAIRHYQRFAAIPQTGEIDAMTLKMMKSKRCGVADEDAIKNTAKGKRYFLLNKGWAHNDLTYRIIKYPASYLTKLTQQEVDDTIVEAFKFWSDVSQLTIKVLPTGTVDIVIKFGAGNHGDRSAFDGAGGVLAHAYSPHTQTGGTVDAIYGDAHFDDAETWTIQTYSGINLLQVAVHEFGHSLGIGHSEDIDAIMFAYYRGYVPGMQLHSDDVSGIQTLYGAPNTDPEGPTDPEDCDVSFEDWGQMVRKGSKKFPNATTLLTCKNACVASDICWAFSWKNVNRKVIKCFLYELRLVNVRALDFYFKVLSSDGTSSYKKMESMKHKKGKDNGKVSQKECQASCDGDDECIGYSYMKNPKKRQRWWCRVHSMPVVGQNRRITHYVKTTTCN